MDKQYRLIALDMDGTLLSSQKEITPKTCAAIRQATAQGVYVVMCTGRGQREVEDYFRLLPEIRYAICNSGAYIYDSVDKVYLYPHPLSEELLAQVMDVMEPRDTLAQIFVEGVPYFTQEKMDSIDTYQVGYFKDLFLKSGIVCANAYDVARAHTDRVFKFCFYHRSPEQRSESRQLLAHLPLEMADAETSSLEVSPAGIDKGATLRTLCDHLGIHISETIAVGDSFNDLSVLKVAGCAVAMGNAREEVKAVCDLIVADCDHDGVAEAIETLILERSDHHGPEQA